jgi:hypothetical protein
MLDPPGVKQFIYRETARAHADFFQSKVRKIRDIPFRRHFNLATPLYLSRLKTEHRRFFS